MLYEVITLKLLIVSTVNFLWILSCMELLSYYIFYTLNPIKTTYWCRITSYNVCYTKLLRIAVTYYKLGEYSESLNYLRIAMDSINNDNSIYRKIYLNYYMGKALLKLDKIDSAQEALFMTLTLCDANNINYKIAEAFVITSYSIHYTKLYDNCF